MPFNIANTDQNYDTPILSNEKKFPLQQRYYYVRRLFLLDGIVK